MNQKEPSLIKPGQALIISDGAILEEVLMGLVYKFMDRYNAEKEQESKGEQWVEQHLAAKMLGKSVATLSRWAKAGRIDRVPDEDKHGREVYYYLRDIEKEKAALNAKRNK